MLWGPLCLDWGENDHRKCRVRFIQSSRRTIASKKKQKMRVVAG